MYCYISNYFLNLVEGYVVDVHGACRELWCLSSGLVFLGHGRTLCDILVEQQEVLVKVSDARMYTLLPTDVLDTLAQWLTHADARCCFASCRVLREYWFRAGLVVHPWCRTVPWCRCFCCPNRRVVRSVEPFLARGEGCELYVWRCVSSLVQLPGFLLLGLFVVPVCTFFWSWGRAFGARRVLALYWKKEDDLFLSFCCACPAVSVSCMVVPVVAAADGPVLPGAVVRESVRVYSVVYSVVRGGTGARVVCPG
jgi:hypothetical protein